LIKIFGGVDLPSVLLTLLVGWQAFQGRIFGYCWCKIFYRPDALPL